MKVEHSCGHEVDASPYSAPFVRRTFCWACEQLAKRLQEEQNRKFAEALKEEIDG